MAFFDKLAFWKKKDDDFGLGDLPPLPDDTSLGLPDLGSENMPGYPSEQNHSYQQPVQERPVPRAPITPQQYYEVSPPQSQQQQQYPPQNREMEVVSAKLDSIRVTLDSINQRIANIERIAYKEEEQPKIRRQW